MSDDATPHGWDEDRLVYQCSDGPHPSWRKTILDSPEWEAWEREIARRLRVLNETDSEIERRRLLNEQSSKRLAHRRDKLNVWDVDECAGVDWMSAEHWEDFVKFIRTKKAVRARYGAKP